MNTALRLEIEQALHDSHGGDVRIVAMDTAAAGSFAQTARLTLQDGERLFLKYAATPSAMFACEHRSLRLLHAAHASLVPEPLCSSTRFIVARWLDFGRKAPDWEERLGRELALLQRRTRTVRHGFEHDNYLGASVQLNAWHDSWLEFWRACRLGAQLDMWREQAAPGDTLLTLGERLLNRLDVYLNGVTEDAVLLHGDLWAGNAAATPAGSPVIYDPASYYGHREAEFGMMRLFGGFGPRVEAAYEEIWPFEPGSEERIALYRLYHELNHLNLFGASYYGRCMETIRLLL